MPHLLAREQQAQADRLAGEHSTLLDRVVAAGYSNELSDQDVEMLRAEMSVLSSQYFDLTGEILK